MLRPHRVSFCMMVACGTLAVSACQSKPMSRPEDTYRRFADAITRQDAKAAWALLSDSSQKSQAEQMRQVAAASKGALAAEPAELMFQTGIKAGNGKVGRVVTEGDTARLEVDTASGPSVVTLVREGGKWKIDLETSLAQSRGT